MKNLKDQIKLLEDSYENHEKNLSRDKNLNKLSRYEFIMSTVFHMPITGHEDCSTIDEDIKELCSLLDAMRIFLLEDQS